MANNNQAAAAYYQPGSSNPAGDASKPKDLTPTEKLLIEGRRKARMMIVDKYHSPDQLEDAGLHAINLEKELALVNTKVNSEVQTKLDSLKNAVDLMDESQLQLNKLQANITWICERINKTDTSISKTEKVKRLHNARENIQRVIEQVAFFNNAPKRVEELAMTLENDPLMLREVYLESLKLDALRTAVTKELRVSKHRRKSVDNNGNISTNTTQSVREDYKEETIREIEKNLKMVPELVRIVRAKVFSIIERLFDIADETPALLVQAFELIEMQQEYNDRRNHQYDQEAQLRQQYQAVLNSNVNLNTVPGLSAAQIQILSSPSNTSSHERHENIHVTIEQKLRELMDGLIESEFQAKEALVAQHGSTATAIRMIGTQILGRMKYFQTTILPCIPMNYDAMFIFLEAFDFVMSDALKDIVLNELMEMKVSDILDLISWLEFCLSSYRDFDPSSTRDIINDFITMKQELVMEYKGRIKTQIHSWFQNIQDRNDQDEITKTNEGTLITSHPEDMFNIIHAQLNVAKEKLPPEYIKEVAIACLQVLQDVQRQSYDKLQRNVQEMDASELCAIVNDNQRMEEKCQEFTEEMLRYVFDQTEKEMLGNIANEVSMEYLQIANKAVSSIVRYAFSLPFYCSPLLFLPCSCLLRFA